MRDWNSFVVCLVLFSSFAAANDGVLPRGRGQVPAPSPAVPQAVEASKNEEETLFLIDCNKYFANPNTGEFYFSPNKQSIFFLSKSAGEVQRPDSKTYVYEIDLGSRVSRRIVGLKLEANPVLIGHGQPIDGASVFDLKRGRPTCGEGQSAGVGVQWSKQQRIVKNFPAARYKVIGSDIGNYLADLDQYVIQSFDFSSLQKRVIASFPKEHIPIYAEFQPPKVVAFHPEAAELRLFTGGNKQADSILVLKKGAKFIQSAGQFGLLEPGGDAQKIVVRTIKGWSGDSFRSHTMELPKDWSVENIRVDYDFNSEVGLVQSADFKMRRGSVAPQFRSVLLYNKAKASPLAELTVAKDQYLGVVSLSPDGKLVYALVRSLSDDGARSFKIWSVEDGKWLEDILLTRELPHEANPKVKSKG